MELLITIPDNKIIPTVSPKLIAVRVIRRINNGKNNDEGIQQRILNEILKSSFCAVKKQYMQKMQKKIIAESFLYAK